MLRWLDRLVAQQSWLERLGDPTQKQLSALLARPGARQIKNILDGTWLGHPLHPVLTDIPVGAWTTTAVLDALAVLRGDSSLDDAADISLAVGWAGSVASAVTGTTQWNDTYGRERSLGLLHGLMMLGSVSAYTWSFALRRAGARGAGMALAGAGYTLLSAGAYLGGDEAYDLGYGVNHTAFTHGPSDYVAVMPDADLPANTLTRADAGGTPIVLVRLDTGIFALDDTCTHAGCSLAGGTLQGRSVICPCHGSQFNVVDGSVINGPATYREPDYFVRIRDGMIEVKQKPA